MKIETTEDLLQAAHDDPRYIIESGFWVINKDKAIVPFIFNRLQNEFYDQRTTRDDILKGSQLGFSSMILAILTIKFLLVPNAWCVCISHESEATKRLFEKVNFYLTHLPDWLKQFYKPEEDSQKNLANGVMNSRFYIGTAAARAFGRGDTIHYAHLSEVSRWADAGNIATGIIRACPMNDPHTWIVKETTANGQGNWHHIEYQRERNGESEFKRYFALWMKHEEYTLPEAKLDDLDPEEQRIRNRFPDLADDGRLAWRRKMIAQLPSDKGWTPEDLFKQEFPLDEDEAFLFSGNPFFPVDALEDYTARCKEPIFTGNLEGVSPYEHLDETERGYLKLWDMPQVAGQYQIAADVATFNDFCVATILDKKTWKTIGKWRGHINPAKFGDELNKLGFFFNKALIIVEANNMGQSTVDRLVELDYPNLYQRERFNQVEKKTTQEYGFWTDNKTKPLYLGYFQDLIRRRDIEIPDANIIGEMRTFVRTEEGKLEAQEGCFDDCVISIGINYFVLKEHPFVEKKPIQGSYQSAAKRYQKFRGGKKVGFRGLGRPQQD